MDNTDNTSPAAEAAVESREHRFRNFIGEFVLRRITTDTIHFSFRANAEEREVECYRLWVRSRAERKHALEQVRSLSGIWSDAHIQPVRKFLAGHRSV